jgi:outer membrane protein assembly factor BamD
VLAGCLRWQSEDFTGSPDKVLFNRAMVAMEDGKFDVARLVFQTLVNTYPDSDYAEKAKEMLRDSQLYGTGSNRDASTCDTSPDSMCFFPTERE